MPNILLTERCVRSCPYCFAQQYMDHKEDKTAITIENFDIIIEFLKKSSIKNISLLGGEPLLHKEIDTIISKLLNQEFMVKVFTSGIMAQSRLNSLVDTIHKLELDLQKRIKFIVNVNEPSLSKPAENKKVEEFLSCLGEYCSLSFNIYRMDFDINFLVDFIFHYGLRRTVRLGIANPIPGYKNEYLKPEKFKDVGEKLMDHFHKWYELGIIPFFDCGFPLCMFNDEQIGKLYKYTHNGLDFDCGPTIDIGPDLSCWCCFPLSKIKRKSLLDFADYEELYSYFNQIQNNYRKESRGIYNRCKDCKNYDNEVCGGGCLAHILNDFLEEGFERININN